MSSPYAPVSDFVFGQLQKVYMDGGLFAFFLPLHFYLLLSDFIPYITVFGEEPQI